MCGCANEEECIDEEKAGANSLPREGREGLSNYATSSQRLEYQNEEKCAAGEEFENLKMRKFENEEEPANDRMTNDLMTNDLMTNDLMTNDQMTQTAKPRINFNPAGGLKTSTIDKLLTPEIVDHIKRTTTRENAIRGKGNGNLNLPNTLINTEAYKSGT